MIKTKLPRIQQAPENVLEGFRRLGLAFDQFLQLIKLVGGRLATQTADE